MRNLIAHSIKIQEHFLLCRQLTVKEECKMYVRLVKRKNIYFSDAKMSNRGIKHTIRLGILYSLNLLDKTSLEICLFIQRWRNFQTVNANLQI